MITIEIKKSDRADSTIRPFKYNVHGYDFKTKGEVKAYLAGLKRYAPEKLKFEDETGDFTPHDLYIS